MPDDAWSGPEAFDNALRWEMCVVDLARTLGPSYSAGEPIERLVKSVGNRIVDCLASDGLLADARGPEGQRTFAWRDAVQELATALGWHSEVSLPTLIRYAFHRLGEAEAEYGTAQDLNELMVRLVALVEQATSGLGNLTQPSATARFISDALSDLTGGAIAAAVAGCTAERERLEADPLTSLARALISNDHRALPTLAERADWPLPSRLAAIRGGPVPAELRTLRTPADMASDPGLLLVASEHLPIVMSTLEASERGQFAVSMTVQTHNAGLADKQAQRALELARRGLIDGGQMLLCEELGHKLWLYAEPVLRARLTQTFLEPLATECDRSRLVLGETLAAILTTRASFNVIADQLEVHPQTIHYRWRRLKKLFGGPVLADPEHASTIVLLLNTHLPQWRNGDFSELEDALDLRGATGVAE